VVIESRNPRRGDLMKVAVSALVALVVTIALALPAGAAPPPPIAGPKNPSFEQNFNFWTVTVPPPPTDATATIVPGQVRQGGGTRFARLTTDGPGGGAMIDQTFNGAAGLTVTGFARFNNGELNGECFFVDTALVEIDGNPVFQADSCTTGDTGGVVWTYVLTTTGSHTIHGEVQNGTDSVADSSLDMDAPLLFKVP
jgi:hypothetical protein